MDGERSIRHRHVLTSRLKMVTDSRPGTTASIESIYSPLYDIGILKNAVSGALKDKQLRRTLPDRHRCDLPRQVRKSVVTISAAISHFST
jgi:PP-loop superfamily ATP-utilizing enzyme